MTDPSSSYRIVPTPGRVAIELVKADEMTAGGIVLLEETRATNAGIVHSVCEEYEIDGEPYSPLFQPGEKVVFGNYTGTRLTMGRRQVVVMKETDVLARLVETTEEGAALQEVKVDERY